MPYKHHVLDVRVRAAAAWRPRGRTRSTSRGVGSTPPIFGAAAGADFRAIATIQYRNQEDDGDPRSQGLGHHLARAAQGQDDRRRQGQLGARAAAPGPAPHRAEAQRRQAQLPAPADGLAAFSSGQVDAWAVWHPFIEQAQADGAEQIAGGPPDEHGHSFEIASSKAVADPKRAAALKRLRRAPEEGVRVGRQAPGRVGRPRGRRSPACRSSHEGRRCASAVADIGPSPDGRSPSSSSSPTGLTDDKVLPGQGRLQETS